MSFLSVNQIEKTFGNTKVLNGISFDVNQGDVIAILGSSGSGKTTLLRCINFLEHADSGKLVFDGTEYDLAHMRRKEISAIRKKTAFVFQNYNLFANKTALENTTLGLTSARGMSKHEAEEIGMRMLEKVGMADKADHYPVQLSGGQQQRVAIARALATDPEIIFFDEPTSALDPELIGEVLSVIRDLANEGRTMLIVTHEMTFAEHVSNRVLFLENGNILEEGSSKEFFQNQKEARVRDFLDSMKHQGDK